jgi:hypothetical protein
VEVAPDPAAVELAKCAGDAAYFCDTFGIIDDAQGHGQGGGVMPFRLWPAQTRVMWQLMTMRLLIILKARQLGISWLCCAYALWLCVFAPGKVVLCFSRGQGEANELIRRIKALYDRLPEWMRETLPKLTKDNTEELEWKNGSRVHSLPATKSAGRSFTASLVIMDEAAFLMWAGALYTALKPTIDAGGQLIILSTANGLGNLFHLLWTRAVKKLNAFQTIFLPWWARPGRTQAWYRQMVAEHPDPEKIKQEYPASAVEAFIATGRNRFQPAWVRSQAAHVREPIPLGDLPEALKSLATRAATGYNQVLIYALPVEGRSYILAADVAEGLEKGDFSPGVVIDAETWEEMACIHGHWEPDIFGGFLGELGTIYNLALVAVERNNHGHTVLARLKNDRYLNVADGPDDKPGWLSNIKTKPQSIDTLAEALRDVLCFIRTQMALDEIQIYEVKPDGTTGAPEGYFDDMVMAWAIAISVARRPVQHENPLLTPVQLMAGIKRVRS